MGRLRELRAYIYRIDELNGTPLLSLRDYFELAPMELDLQTRIDSAGWPTISCRTEYMHHIMTAKAYFQIDIGPFVEHVNRTIQFESSSESTRGEEALEKGGPLKMLELADALHAYADAATKLSEKGCWDKPGAGFYLLRKSAHLDYLIRMETGLRPGVLDFLTVSEDGNGRGAFPSVWKAGEDVYNVHVPWVWMKQHRGLFFGKAEALDRICSRDQKKKYVKGYKFTLQLPQTVAALDEYLEHGWPHARDVISGSTRNLLLNGEGRALVRDERAYQRSSTCILENVRRAIEYVYKTEGRQVAYYTRYHHRHVISHYLELHLPGHGLKTAYLTHSQGTKSDWYYGSSENTLLGECLQEIFSGLPPRAEQLKLKEAEKDAQIADLQRRIIEMTDLVKSKETEKQHKQNGSKESAG